MLNIAFVLLSRLFPIVRHGNTILAGDSDRITMTQTGTGDLLLTHDALINGSEWMLMNSIGISPYQRHFWVRVAEAFSALMRNEYEFSIPLVLLVGQALAALPEADLPLAMELQKERLVKDLELPKAKPRVIKSKGKTITR